MPRISLPVDPPRAFDFTRFDLPNPPRNSHERATMTDLSRKLDWTHDAIGIMLKNQCDMHESGCGAFHAHVVDQVIVLDGITDRLEVVEDDSDDLDERVGVFDRAWCKLNGGAKIAIAVTALAATVFSIVDNWPF